MTQGSTYEELFKWNFRVNFKICESGEIVTVFFHSWPVWPDWANYSHLGDFYSLSLHFLAIIVGQFLQVKVGFQFFATFKLSLGGFLLKHTIVTMRSWHSFCIQIRSEIWRQIVSIANENLQLGERSNEHHFWISFDKIFSSHLTFSFIHFFFRFYSFQRLASCFT